MPYLDCIKASPPCQALHQNPFPVRWLDGSASAARCVSYGNGFGSMTSAKLNMAEVAPMPMDVEQMDTAVKPGSLRSTRKAGDRRQQVGRPFFSGLSDRLVRTAPAEPASTRLPWCPDYG